jgi:hypothetical protein
MEHQFAELIGISAAAASLYAAHAKTIIPLRIAAIVANALAMMYSFLHGTYPTFALNAILLPLNTWRLRSMLHLVRDIDSATKSDMNVDWLLPYTRPRDFNAGDIIMQRGLLCRFPLFRARSRCRGRCDLEQEHSGRRSALSTPDSKRTMTIRCKTVSRAGSL